MFENLTDRLSGSLKKITGQAKLTEDNIKETLREVRMALLEADVALPVVKDFVEGVRQRAIGQEVQRSLTPGQVFVKVVQQELERVMGEGNESLNLSTRPPAVIMMSFSRSTILSWPSRHSPTSPVCSQPSFKVEAVASSFL